ncbi:hypothetical protein BLNAU_18622 [Blattamonas nauphoetae]|uniref:Uncharacterized protein n=1 Tax=Blattamonas nauphoetae TaxID=2049346 RepID=A0ABQ9X3W1_9EUKA|nr:hypothetical protein BLNAU_18622 [Blattamonas nauphoetae]
MGTAGQLVGGLVTSSIFLIVSCLANITAIVFYFLAFRNYEKAGTMYKRGKFIQTCGAMIYGAFKLIFWFIVVIGFPHYGSFVHTVDLLAFVAFAIGSLLCLIAVNKHKKRLLFGQILELTYLGVHFVVLISTFISKYTIQFERVMEILNFLFVAFSIVMGSFLSFELFQRYSNEEKINRQSQMGHNDSSAFDPKDEPTEEPVAEHSE